MCLSLMALPAAAGESPTLDELHNNGVINPSTMEKDNDGNRIEGTGEVYPESAYTLTRVDTAGENTITKYEYNEETQKFEPVYYELTLKQTEYGEGGNSKYFEWEQNSEGDYEFKEVAGPSGDKTTITAHYDTNYGRIDTDQQGKDIVGDFVGNYVQNSSGAAKGGAIYNSSGGTIGNITGDFIGNYAQGNSYLAIGGAIYNYGTIGNITGDFIGNYAQSDSKSASSGAIYNYGEIGDITGDFIGNYAQSDSYDAYGGAIDNYGEIGDITGNFIGNYAIGSYKAYGGAIDNDGGTIGNITGDFIGNYAQGDYAYGGAIYNDGKIGDITGDFIGNYAQGDSDYAYGGAIYNGYGSTIGNITGDFIGNYAQSDSDDARGGAIYNYGGTIGNIMGDFIGNYAQGDYAYGGAIYNDSSGNIGDITGDFIANYAQSDSIVLGGAIYNDRGTIGDISGSFIGNYATTESDTELALGGAVYTSDDMTFSADNKTIEFTGNYTKDSRGEIPNAIWVDTNNTHTVTLKARNNGNIVFNDQIDGGAFMTGTIDRTKQYNLSLTGDKTGNIYFNNDIINADITLDEVSLNLGRDDVLNQSNTLALNSGALNMANGAVGSINIPNFALNGTASMSADVDLANETMDRIEAENYTVSPDSKLNVTNLHLLSDATKDNVSILFADKELAGNVEYTGVSPIAYSPIYKYDVSYNPNDGFFTFLRGSSSNPSDNFNPTVLSTPVTSQAGAYATQMQTFNYAFQHADNFMNLPLFERIALKESGRYATLNTVDSGVYSPLLTRVEQAGFWVKPYVSFENIPLKNGPEVTNIAYGSLIGFDSSMKPIKHGFDRVLTGYVGYNGASQSYSGVDSYQNGGLIGGTMTLYKNNFFNATTISAGASVGESYNMYGHDNFTMFLAGIANKLGYNFEFKNGRYIIQPSLMMSYTFVNTFDYTNAAGVDINSDPMHAIQLSPGVKFIMNTKNGWQPYVGVNMVWNVMDTQKVTANDVRLPEMSIKPYVQYGLGLQKKIKDKFLAFGQAMVSNGGRNGISLSFGLRWFIGRE